MLVYEGIKSEFINDVNLNAIVNKIYDRYKKFFGKTTESQLNSWKNSMQYMRGVLSDNEIPDNTGIAIEYNIPQTAKRVDFMVSGYDAAGKPGMVIIEIKQWSSLEKVDKTETLVETYVGNAMRKVVHPSYQAWSYAQLIKDYNENTTVEIILFPCQNKDKCSGKIREILEDIMIKFMEWIMNICSIIVGGIS